MANGVVVPLVVVGLAVFWSALVVGRCYHVCILFPTLLLLLAAAGILQTYGAVWLAYGRSIIFRLPKLPPGSMGLPYWGESKRYVDSWSNVADPDAFYRDRQAKYGNVFRTRLFGAPTIVLLGPKGNKFIYDNEHKLFDSDWPLNIKEFEGATTTTMLLGSKAHGRMRKALQTCYSLDAVRSYTTLLEDAIVAHLEHNWEGDVQLAHHLLEDLMFQVFANAFLSLRVNSEDASSFVKLCYTVASGILDTSFKIPLPGTTFAKARQARLTVLDIIYKEMNARREGHSVGCKGDILDRFMVLDNPYLSDLEIAENVFALHNTAFTVAGASMIILKNLAADPKLQMKLRQESKSLAATKNGQRLTWDDLTRNAPFINNVISEGLRIQAPMFGTFKRAIKDVMFEGFLIPKGWRVHNNLRMTHNHEEFYLDPTKFDPDRFSAPPEAGLYTPFGGGLRVCPGKEFALAIMRLLLYHLGLKYELELRNPHEEMRVYLFPAPKEGLPMRITRIPQ